MKWLKRILLVLVIVFVAAQFSRPNLTNPPIDDAKVLRAPANVQAILDRSCIDCHSNRTVHPWYSQITPVSWWLANHIKDGRREVNFSEIGGYSAKKAAHKMEEICEQVEKGEMPLPSYLWVHWSAKLSEADRRTLCDWAKSEQQRIKTTGVVLSGS
jgi:hypothetical protein